jgi:hypothetical protein
MRVDRDEFDDMLGALGPEREDAVGKRLRRVFGRRGALRGSMAAML